jgi:ubiquinone/menaquinone biosynthesis C-methylase UbiE
MMTPRGPVFAPVLSISHRRTPGSVVLVFLLSVGACRQAEAPPPATPAPAALQASATMPVPSASQRVQGMINGHIPSMLVSVAAKLHVADHLREGPQPVAALAAATKTHEDSLYRLLRALTEIGVFSEEPARTFRLNEAGELLRSDVQGSLRASAEVAGEPWMRGPWGALLHSIQTGDTAFDHVYGTGTFDWFAENREEATLFDTWQAANTDAGARAVAAAYDFSTAQSVVDVGGGFGALLTAVLQRSAGAKGVLFDLPHVIAQARTRFDPALAPRVEFVPGDFFKAVPSGHDIYLMKYILHDWNDERSRAILASTRTAMGGRGRLLVVEVIVNPPNQPGGKVGDIFMLVRTGGRNRTEPEYRDLLARGGFDVTRLIRTGSDLSIMEATPRP